MKLVFMQDHEGFKEGDIHEPSNPKRYQSFISQGVAKPYTPEKEKVETFQMIGKKRVKKSQSEKNSNAGV